MINLCLAVLAVLWCAANLWLWSMKQSHEALLLQSVAMAALGYPVLVWWALRSR